MRLIFGLGNPGNEYKNTRHNIGFMFLDFILDNVEFSLNKKMNALEYETFINEEKVLFVKPLSYMNLSGEVVSNYLHFYKLSIHDILVIQDDLDMNLGLYKLLFNHGDGGHNGIKNIILNLGSKEFLRLKIGISKADIDTKDYVLGKFSKENMKLLNNTFEKLHNFIYDYVSMNRDLLIGKYNCKDNN